MTHIMKEKAVLCGISVEGVTHLASCRLLLKMNLELCALCSQHRALSAVLYKSVDNYSGIHRFSF